jgi:hypothetical protein
MTTKLIISKDYPRGRVGTEHYDNYYNTKCFNEIIFAVSFVIDSQHGFKRSETFNYLYQIFMTFHKYIILQN